MSRTLNKVMLIGNVGKNPELKHTPSGIPVTSFRMATSKVWRDRDGKKKEHTDWHTIVAWRKLAEVITKIVGKGARVYVEGRLQTRSFDQDGEKKQVVEVLADNLLLLESKDKRDADYDDPNDYGDDSFDNNLDDSDTEGVDSSSDSFDSFDSPKNENYDSEFGEALNTNNNSSKEYSF